LAIKNLNDEEVPEKCQERSENEACLDKEIKGAEAALDIKPLRTIPGSQKKKTKPWWWTTIGRLHLKSPFATKWTT